MVCTAVTGDGTVETVTTVTGDTATVEVTGATGVRSATTVAFGDKKTKKRHVCLAPYECACMCTLDCVRLCTNLQWSQRGRGC